MAPGTLWPWEIFSQCSVCFSPPDCAFSLVLTARSQQKHLREEASSQHQQGGRKVPRCSPPRVVGHVARLPNAGDQLSGRGERPQCFPNQLISASVLSDLKKLPVCSLRAFLNDALLVFTQMNYFGHISVSLQKILSGCCTDKRMQCVCFL